MNPMNLIFFALFAVVFAGHSLNFHFTSVDRNDKQGNFKSSSGREVMVNIKKGKIKLVLNSDSTFVDSVSRQYLNIKADGSITFSKQPQKGFKVKSSQLKFNGSFGKLKRHFVFDWNSNLPESESLGVTVYSSNPVPDVIP